jgi:CBS domain-containing protein
MAETINWILRNKSGGRIFSIAPDATVYDALALMAEKEVGALMVLSMGKLVGIISERDYARKIILQGRSSRATTVQEIMTGDMFTVTSEDTIDECMRIMTHHHIRHLPVLDQGKLVGVISIGDLVNAIIVEQARMIDHLHTYIGANYPA